MKPQRTTSDERGTEWAITINEPTDKDGSLMPKAIYEKIKNVYPEFIALIKHDLDEENGKLKRPHIHVVMKTHRTRKETLINDLADILGFPKNVIQVEKAKNFRGAVRYLTHIDYEEKYHYPPFDVLCNDQQYFESCFINRITNLTEEELIEIVRKERTPSRILVSIGFENYRKYATIIRDLIKQIL